MAPSATRRVTDCDPEIQSYRLCPPNNFFQPPAAARQLPDGWRNGLPLCTYLDPMGIVLEDGLSSTCSWSGGCILYSNTTDTYLFQASNPFQQSVPIV